VVELAEEMEAAVRLQSENLIRTVFYAMHCYVQSLTTLRTFGRQDASLLCNNVT
jgi:hypothetical protein